MQYEIWELVLHTYKQHFAQIGSVLCLCSLEELLCNLFTVTVGYFCDDHMMNYISCYCGPVSLSGAVMEQDARERM